MDQGKHTRVALFTGLLFLIFAAQGLQVWKMADAYEKSRQEILGYLLTEYPRFEPEVVRVFHGKGHQGEAPEENKRKKARELGHSTLEKYGYRTENLSAASNREWKQTAGTLFLGMAVLLLYFYWNHRGRIKEAKAFWELQQEFEDLKRRYGLAAQRFEREENSTKALITDLSHQLKTPIASLKMSLEIESTTELTEEEKAEFWRREYDEVKRMERLLDALFHLSQLEARMVQLHPERCSLKKMILQAVNTVYMKAYEKHMEISLEEFEDEGLMADVRWTTEALVNLLDNAVKYSPGHTKIQIRSKKMTTYLLVEVEDQGIGIGIQESYEIFHRFYRGSSKEVKRQEGSGVGLYLARRIVEDQGGTLSVRPGLYAGSVFCMTLPRG